MFNPPETKQKPISNEKFGKMTEIIVGKLAITEKKVIGSDEDDFHLKK